MPRLIVGRRKDEKEVVGFVLHSRRCMADSVSERSTWDIPGTSDHGPRIGNTKNENQKFKKLQGQRKSYDNGIPNSKEANESTDHG